MEALEFVRSDGDSSHWPVCKHIKDGERWERLESDDDLVTQYLDKLSTQLADQFGRPHIIHALPDGYALFAKYTMNGSRQDRYLIGSRHVKRFRSPAEFAPHAYWLLSDLSLENLNCLCKYCDKKPTRTVKRSEPIASGPIAPTTSSRRAQRVSRTSSSLTQTSQLSTSGEARRLFRVLKIPSDLDSNRFPPSPSDIDGGPFYRKGEIIWLILSKPVMLGCAVGMVDGFIIRFWPSIIEMGEDYGSPLTVPHGHGTPAVAPLRVRLFSSGIIYHVPQHSILPFWAHSPDQFWLQNLRLQTHKSLSGVQDPFVGFVKVSESPPGEETPLASNTLLSHFIFDVETSLEIARSWSTASATPSSQPGRELAPIRPRLSIMPEPCRELWWGAERIMLGDLIRLKIPESKLHKFDADRMRFIPRSFPEPPTEETLGGGSEMEDGQLFFKLRSLAIVEGINGRGLHGFGGLYRLVPVGHTLLPPLAVDSDHRHVALPCPPEGFNFQSALQGGWEIELSLHHIDGRYYPRMQELLLEPSGVDAHVLEVLEGIVCWRALPLRPLYFKKGSRKGIIARMVGELRKSKETIP